MMLMFPHTSADYDHDDCVEVKIRLHILSGLRYDALHDPLFYISFIAAAVVAVLLSGSVKCVCTQKTS